jgi:hypothetical protein
MNTVFINPKVDETLNMFLDWDKHFYRGINGQPGSD